MRYRFWMWALRLAKRKCSDAYARVNLRCPVCFTWTAETDGPSDVEENLDSGTTIVECRQCGAKAQWHLDTPAPFSIGVEHPLVRTFPK